MRAFNHKKAAPLRSEIEGTITGLPHRLYCEVSVICVCNLAVVTDTMLTATVLQGGSAIAWGPGTTHRIKDSLAMIPLVGKPGKLFAETDNGL